MSRVKGTQRELHSIVKIPPEHTEELARWIARLDAGARDARSLLPLGANEESRVEFVRQFADEYGNRARTTEPFLRCVLGLSAHPESDPSDLDERLWWSLCSDQSIVLSELADGPTLTPPSDDIAIEHWTQIELCALHALWTINQRSSADSFDRRIIDAAVWIMHELQPDNAINRPWALPVFIMLSLTLDDDNDRATASMYAQTLLHNCSITMGKPDILSSCILLHSAESLRQLS